MLHQLIILLSFLIVLPWLESLDGTKHKDYLVKARLRESEDSSRINVFDSLDASSGIFKDRQKVEELRLENTLLITVAAFNIHYGMRAVVYILHHNVEDFSSLKEEMEEHDIQLMSYPDVLFWELVNNKTQPIRKGKNFATYDGQFPSFREYGALVMLVPAFEALQLGFNVVYLDIDIGLVQNPIPYLVRGDADFVLQMEMKYCPEIFSSSRVSKDGWYTVEPNTGVMHIRSTPQSIKFYQNWLQRIVNSNVMNDQKEFDRIGTRATYTSNCNGGNFATARLHENSASFCFLQEILFQNGMVGVQCYAKQVHRANWIVEMYEHATPIEVSIVKKDFNYSRISRFPILLHVNYCNSKSHELGVRGLWLVKDGNNLSCDSYNINQTWYASFDWEKEVSSIRSNWAQELTNVLVNGTLLKVVGRKEVYVIDELLRKRFIPDKETFQYMNFDWGRMKTIPLRVMNNITEGDPVLIEPQLLYKEEMSKLLSNGTLVRCNGNSSVFVAENFSLREIPDKSTFLSNGFDWKKVQVISKDVFRLMPIGSSLPSSMKT